MGAGDGHLGHSLLELNARGHNLSSALSSHCDGLDASAHDYTRVATRAVSRTCSSSCVSSRTFSTVSDCGSSCRTCPSRSSCYRGCRLRARTRCGRRPRQNRHRRPTSGRHSLHTCHSHLCPSLTSPVLTTESLDLGRTICEAHLQMAAGNLALHELAKNDRAAARRGCHLPGTHSGVRAK